MNFKLWLFRFFFDDGRIAQALYSKYIEDGQPEDIVQAWLYANYIELCRATGYPEEAYPVIKSSFERIKANEIKENFIV